MFTVRKNLGPLISVNNSDDVVVAILVACLLQTMASRVNFEVDLAQIAIEAARRLGYDGLKKKQLEAVVSFLQGNDTFVALPTGYGKSLQFYHTHLTE